MVSFGLPERDVLKKGSFESLYQGWVSCAGSGAASAEWFAKDLLASMARIASLGES
jgi:hypothetical protein